MPWLAEGADADLYLVGGAWRALARIHMAQTGYPLQMVHHYAIGRDEARDLAGLISTAGAPRAGAPARHAAPPHRRPAVCRGGAAPVAARDRRAPGGVQRQRPARGLVHAAHARGRARRRTPCSPPAAIWQRGWDATHRCRRRCWPGRSRCSPTKPPEARRLREAACWLSDIGSHDHPEFRAGAGVPAGAAAAGHRAGPSRPRVPRPGHGACATRWKPTPASCAPPALLLDVASANRAEVLGIALRLAYTLSAGTPDLLAGTALSLRGGQLLLRLQEDSGVFAGESVMRRLDRLAQAVGLEAATEAATAARAA